MTIQNEQKRDLVLHPGEYCYMQDQTRGLIKTHVGPTVINQTAQELPVAYNNETRQFTRCSLETAVVRGPLASEGEYIVLENPASDNTKPEEGSSKASPILKVGCKVNVAGPAQFALWPTQRATVIRGHHLRSNQYLLVRIYNVEEARQNWRNAVAVRASENAEATVVANADALGLTIGKLLIIKGTEVSFYIPPTGVEVVIDEAAADDNIYVREAVTLERLEYSILIDENGTKRYEKGPQVVFPKPTENFYTENDSRKFKAIELTKIQGLHIKVIASYEENGTTYNVGDELFITGEQLPIYYPRVEHSIIRYGERNKHSASALPAGEGRYVMNKETGDIKTAKGPLMLLPDPRKEVIVRRVLSDKQVNRWYPGNQEALSYNRQLREVSAAAPSSRSGFVSEGDVQRSRGNKIGSPISLQDYAEEAIPLEATFAATIQHKGLANVPPAMLNVSSGYVQPRTITLDTKYEGVPSITVWTGYAVLVVSKTGTRKVIEGPTTYLLNYDESLEVLALSTGKPKTTDKLEETVYLRTTNNKVSDKISVRTRDHVDVQLYLSYRVNFEGEPEKWFSVENYVKFLCDHIRSVLKGEAQGRSLEDFDARGVEIVRNAILGPDGMKFEENGMVVTDVEVLGIVVEDKEIQRMLNESQQEVVRSNIKLRQSEKELLVSKRNEEILRERVEAEAVTRMKKAELEARVIATNQQYEETKIKRELDLATKQKDADLAKQEVINVATKADLDREKAKADQLLSVERTKLELKNAGLVAETESTVKRFEAFQSGLSESLLQLQSQETLTKVAQAMSVQQMLGGDNLVDVLGKMFKGVNLDAVLAKLTERNKPVSTVR